VRALVLGCGPAGLLAAHAIRLKTGDMPTIFSKRRKSEMYGAQYLHKPIPALKNGAGTEGVMVTYESWGSAQQYREKVYGDSWSGSVSPEDLAASHMAWDIRLTYNELWDMYWTRIMETDLAKAEPSWIEWLTEQYDLVVSSVPKPLLCYKGHTFSAQEVWAIGDAPERGVMSPVRPEANHVVCNGEPAPGWYRAANVFGFCSVEYPEDSKPPIPGAALVNKPTTNNCDCWPSILHVGRYGKWEKGVLSHEAFDDVMEALAP
jgi:hypothetical protein